MQPIQISSYLFLINLCFVITCVYGIVYKKVTADFTYN